MPKKKLLNHSKLTKDILAKYDLSDEEFSKICSLYDFQTFKKGQYFLKEGDISNKVGLLFSGILYAYTTNEYNDKNISRFFYNPENPVVVNFESFIRETKSEETIECFEESYMITIKKNDLTELYKQIPKLNNIGRLIAEDSYIKALKKIKLLQSKNATDRIKVLMHENHDLFKKIPAGFIASYLGMHRNTYNKALKAIY